MAKYTFTNNTYAGDDLAGFMASTLLEADSVKRGLITVLQDVKSRRILLDADDSVVLQTPSGVFADQGTTALQNETYLDPVVYEFMKQEQWDNLILSWESRQIKPGAMNDYLGVTDLTDHMIGRYIEKLQIANERLYWLGKAASPIVNQFSAAYVGLLPAIAAASGTYKVSLANVAGSTFASTGITAGGVVTVASTTNLASGDVVTINVTTSSALTETTNGATIVMLNNPQSYFIIVLSATTFQLQRNYNDINTRSNSTFTGTASAANVSFINVSNVINVLKVIYAQLDPADRAQADFKVQIPLHVSYAYKTAQANAALNVLNAFSDDKKLDYLGMPLEVMNHWQANTILAARTSNLFLGVDLLSDESSLKTLYLGDTTGDDVVRMKARMKSAVNFKFANELFYLSA